MKTIITKQLNIEDIPLQYEWKSFVQFALSLDPRLEINQWSESEHISPGRLPNPTDSVIRLRGYLYHPSPTSYTTDDAIADAGGQWDSYPKEHSNTFHETKFSHAWFSKMMRETIPSISKSPEQILQAELKKVQVKWNFYHVYGYFYYLVVLLKI